MESTSSCSGGEKCDLHLIIENEVLQNKRRVEKLEERTTQSFELVNKSLGDLIVRINTYIGSQEYRDMTQMEMKTLTLKNTEEIGDLKSTIKSIGVQNDSVVRSLNKIDANMDTISKNIASMDKTILGREEVVEVVEKWILEDKNTDNTRWMDSLPAKVSAAMTVLTFISYMVVKVITMMMAL